MNKPKLFSLKKYTNNSGTLIPITFNKKFPIKVKRVFFIYGKKKFKRGDHAHKKCSQFFIPIHGKFKINLRFKNKKKFFILSKKKMKCLLVPPKIWTSVDFLIKNSVIMVLNDKEYNFNDYIEKYDEFLKFEKKI